MKRCIGLLQAASGWGPRAPRRARAAFLALLGAGAPLGCGGEELSDDPLDEPRATAGAAGASSMTGSSRDVEAMTPDTPDASREPSTSEDPSAPTSTDRAAAPGETGIFVGMTAAHNAARAALDLDEPLPELTWSTELAEVAQDWADQLSAVQCGTIEHRRPNPYGENIALRGSVGFEQPFMPEEAVAGWEAEVACWDYGTILGTESCDTACVQGLNSNGCGHYTQLVWRTTRRVGCGYSTCVSGRFTYETWVCNYDPPGNYIGQAPY